MSTPLLDQALALLATPEPFRQWLQGLGIRTAGLAGSGIECPIHNFLKENGVDVFVGAECIKEGGDAPRKESIPEWVIKHIGKCDCTFTYRSEIPAWRALEYLDQIAPPTQEEDVPGLRRYDWDKYPWSWDGTTFYATKEDALATRKKAQETEDAADQQIHDRAQPAPDREECWLAYRDACTAYTNALKSTREHDLLLAMMRRENTQRHEEMTAALDAWLAAKSQLDPEDQRFAEITMG